MINLYASFHLPIQGRFLPINDLGLEINGRFLRINDLGLRKKDLGLPINDRLLRENDLGLGINDRLLEENGRLFPKLYSRNGKRKTKNWFYTIRNKANVQLMHLGLSPNKNGCHDYRNSHFYLCFFFFSLS